MKQQNHKKSLWSRGKKTILKSRSSDMKQGYYKKGNDPIEKELAKWQEIPKTMELYLYFKCNNCNSTWFTTVIVPYSSIQSNGHNQTVYDYCDDCKPLDFQP
jgi:hypothetical protein